MQTGREGAMSYLDVCAVSKSYGGAARRTEVLSGINLTIEKGELVAIIGYSGSGKTTLLSLLAGLTQPDTGRIELDGARVEGPGPDRGVVFQNYSLLPWLTVHGNVALAVDQVFSELSAQERRDLIARYIELVNLSDAAHKRPAELSGGMRQRVAVARALAIDPKILLLDEPLSALDALTRATLQDEIERIWSADRKTVVLITNDIDEAILLADRIVPLTPGPRATLGPSFPVSLPRPRDRKGINRNRDFKRIRHDVTQYMVEGRRQGNAGAKMFGFTLPDVEPIHVRSRMTVL
jgi:nitrate/nitrite transport system ATP-binding protein